MPQSTPLFVGLDVHKDSIAVAHAAGGSTEPPVFVGAIGPRQADRDQLLRRLQGKAAALRFAYEAGPSGYRLYRYRGRRSTDHRTVVPNPRISADQPSVLLVPPLPCRGVTPAPDRSRRSRLPPGRLRGPLLGGRSARRPGRRRPHRDREAGRQIRQRHDTCVSDGTGLTERSHINVGAHPRRLRRG
jgi:hypothetical protein